MPCVSSPIRASQRHFQLNGEMIRERVGQRTPSLREVLGAGEELRPQDKA
jgi:hypothetical protein